MEYYAKVEWAAGDVETAAEELDLDLTEKECEEFLVRNAKHIQGPLIEHGYDIIGELLRYEQVEKEGKD